MTAYQRYSKCAGVVYRLFRAVLLFGLVFILVFPLLYMVSMAFRPITEIYDPSVIWIPKHFTLDNFKEVFGLMKYPETLLTTLKVNIVSALLEVAVASITGYAFARFEFRFKKVLFAIVLLTIIVPYPILLNSLYLHFKNFDLFGILSIAGWISGKNMTVNLLNSPLTFYLPAVLGVGLKAGLFVFMFRQFFKGMPKELEEAAYIDGCGFGKTFLQIMLPNAVPVFITSLVLSSVWYWNDSFIGSMLMSNHRTVMVALTNLNSQILSAEQNVSLDPFLVVTRLQAGCLLAILPALLVYLIIQRFFVQSVDRSGIVG